MHAKLAKFDQVRDLENRVVRLGEDLASLRRDFQQKDYTNEFSDLHAGLKARHDTLLQNLPDRVSHSKWQVAACF